MTVSAASGTIHIRRQNTITMQHHSFVRVGCEFGFISGTAGTDYFSVFPFAHLAFFLPFDERTDFSSAFSRVSVGFTHRFR